MISNHPVSGSIISMQARLTPFLMIAPPGCCCINTWYMYLTGLYELNPTALAIQLSWVSDIHEESFSHWNVDISCKSWYTYLLAQQGLSTRILPRLCAQFYFHRGGCNRYGTNLAHVCVAFTARISWCHSRLTWHYQELAWSNRILDLLRMFRVWIFYFSALL